MKHTNNNKNLYISKNNIDRHLNDGLASLTHLLHSSDSFDSNYLKQKAISYFQSNNPNEIEDPLQLYLPFDFKAEFPGPDKPKFTFIDLFAGIGGSSLVFKSYSHYFSTYHMHKTHLQKINSNSIPKAIHKAFLYI